MPQRSQAVLETLNYFVSGSDIFAAGDGAKHGTKDHADSGSLATVMIIAAAMTIMMLVVTTMMMIRSEGA